MQDVSCAYLIMHHLPAPPTPLLPALSVTRLASLVHMPCVSLLQVLPIPLRTTDLRPGQERNWREEDQRHHCKGNHVSHR